MCIRDRFGILPRESLSILNIAAFLSATHSQCVVGLNNTEAHTSLSRSEKIFCSFLFFYIGFLSFLSAVVDLVPTGNV